MGSRYQKRNGFMRSYAAACCAAAMAMTAPSCGDDSAPKNGFECETGLIACGHSCCADTCCDGVCIDTEADADHCGACGNACDGGEVCAQSQCLPQSEACGGGKTWCGGACADTMTDDDNCGACGVACNAFESCIQGACALQCPDNRTLCPDANACVDLKTDADHCGSCSNACGGNMHCANGTCACPAGTSNCDGDASNGCEVLSLRCPAPAQCSGETAQCGDGCCAATCCGAAACVDTMSDPLHCGDCDTKCETTQRCEAGVCADDISGCDRDGDAPCFGVCADLQTDADHCGACGHACSDDEICAAGACEDARLIDCFGVGRKACHGTCANIYADDANCGDCGIACGENKICRSGKCIDDPAAACATTEKLCFGRCVDFVTDSAHCGSCTTKCKSGEVCIDGLCKADCAGAARCGDACADLQTDAGNCGECGKSCLDGESCAEGTCRCSAGHYDCDGNADNGCESQTPCSCVPGQKRACWRGSEETRNKGICKDGSQTCDASGAFWGPCEGGTYPTLVSCDLAGNLNGLDNDCDGAPDTVCRSACDLEAGDKSYIGCEYWSVYLYNLYSDNHTVVMSNPSDAKTATVYVFGKTQSDDASSAPLHTISIAPKGVHVLQLNKNGANMCISTSQMPTGYRIRADHPITAYQFNSWAAASTNSNDASLLIPALSLGKEYIVMTYESQTGGEQGAGHTSYFTVAATEPGITEVTVKTTAPIVKSGAYGTNGHAAYTGPEIAAMEAGETRVFSLSRFDVLTLNTPPQHAEQTGTIVSASKNVAVFGGSRASYVPANAGCCRDHLEEQLFPLQSWGNHYYAARAYTDGTSGDFYRILAQKDNTSVTVSPAVVSPATFTLNAGEFKQFEARDSFEIQADQPISVGQFMPSKAYAGSTDGDPSFILAVPSQQYRKDYAFSVPGSYNVNYITIIAPKTAAVRLDGDLLTMSGYAAIGETDIVVGYEKVDPGIHRVVASEPVGLYGYGSKGISSYGYPIGLDLKAINLN